MTEGNRKLVRILGASIVGLGLMFATTTRIVRADDEDDERAKVIPLDAIAYGNSYGEWAARYLQWAFSFPVSKNPTNDTADCAEAQQGPVWFLASSVGDGPVTRECTVPAGKALFFTLVSVITGAAAFDCEPTVPGVPCNLATLRLTASDLSTPVALELTIDGKPLRRLRRQRVQTPVFIFTLPEDNLFGIPAGTYNPNVVDGYFVMLAPLEPGAHTIHSKAVFTGGLFEGVVIDVTTNLTVLR
jgi:hypothetical protein